MRNQINKDFSKLEENLGIFFQNKEILITAFCHRSFLHEFKNISISHNERLEFLGDAVLELIVSEYLFERFPQKTEGELTLLRSALVNCDSLSQTAKELNFDQYLLLSKGEEKTEGRNKARILANTFEAFVGALYLDKGYLECKNFLQKHLLKKLPEILEKRLYKDAKTIFQEKAQEILGITPTYKVLKETGPDHQKRFLVGLFLGDEFVAEGEGSSKQEAGERAAQKGLKIKNWD